MPPWVRPTNYSVLPAVARGDVLRRDFINKLLENERHTRSAMWLAHNNDGTHNCFEVPKVARTILYTAGPPTYTPETAHDAISGIVRNGVGDITIELASNIFDPYAVSVQVNAYDDKPITWSVEIVDSENIRVRLMSLTSALGAGNAWAAWDGDFDIAIHSRGVDTVSATHLPPQLLWGAMGLRAGDNAWNQLVETNTEARSILLAEHDAIGAHTEIEAGKRFVCGVFDPSTSPDSYFDLFTTAERVTLSRSSTGQVAATWDNALGYAIPFACVSYPSASGVTTAGNLYVVNVEHVDTNGVLVKIFEYDFSGDTWDYAEADFILSVYG